MPATALVIGCGYVGLPLATALRDRYDVHGWVRTEEGAASLRALGFSRVIMGSVAEDAMWRQIDATYDLVMHCASSSRGGESAYEQVFREGIRQVVRHQPGARKLMISSTSVYPQTNGELVTEESPAEPATATGRILREAEQIALDGGTTVVRSSGIYGPNRAMLWDKFQRGDAVIEGDGLRWINQIHRDDLVVAMQHLIDHGSAGEIYNASDDTPVTQRDYYTWCAEFLNQPMPSSGPVDPKRKRGLSSKRVSNAKLRTTGWQPVYPSFTDWFRTAAP